MSDWGLSRALTTLSTADLKAEQVERDKQTLGMMENIQRYDADQERMAQMQQDQMYAQVDAFSKELLGPDRQRINEKASVLNQKIKESLKNYGGSTKKFMQNGGYRLLKNYQHELMNSEEASQYLDNKRNMDLLVQAQMNGKGHLINPTDLKNMRSYEKSGGGQVTYSGLMNDIEMPDPKGYGWKENIPAEDILKHEDNYMKIYGNYVMTHPDLGEPSEKQLIQFVEQNYRGQGNNWQRDLYLQKERAAQAKAAATLRAKKAAEDAKNKNKYRYLGTTSKLLNNASNPNGQKLRLDQFQPGYWNNFENQDLLNGVSGRDYTQYANDFALREAGLIDFNRDNIYYGLAKNTVFERWFTEEYMPRNARMFYEGDESKVAKAILNLDEDQIDYSTGRITGWQPNQHSFTASGVQVDGLKDKLLTDDYYGDYKVNGVISAAYGTVKNGPHKDVNQMIMNVVDAGEIDDKKTQEWDKDIFGEGGELTQDLFIVLENEDGDVFYQPIGISNDRSRADAMNALADIDDYSVTMENSQWMSEQQQMIDQQMEALSAPVNEFYDNLEGRADIMDNVVSELIHFSPTGKYDPRRESLAQSFYGALTQNTPSNGNDPVSIYKEHTNLNGFSQYINATQNAIDLDLTEMLRDPQTNDEAFIYELMKQDPENEEFYRLWIQNMKILNQR